MSSIRGDLELFVSKATLEKVDAAKKYIERKYEAFIKDARVKEKDMQRIQQKMTRLQLNEHQQAVVLQKLKRHRSQQLRLERAKQSIDNYELLAIIGKGSFGQVGLCRHKSSKELVAIKRLHKNEMVKRNQVNHINLQKEILSRSNTEYIVKLKSCFQDSLFLYFVLEYLPGGDFMNLLIERDTLAENESKFYMAHLIVAVHQVHELGFIHRDIKPDNILIDEHGHVKLTDFGLIRYMPQNKENEHCGHMRSCSPNFLTKIDLARKNHLKFKNFRKALYSKVGTPEYIAPEILNDEDYDEAIDWWSVGVIFFQMMFGHTPFCADSPKEVCQRILNWKAEFELPAAPTLSDDAISLLMGLICDKSQRLNFKELQQHRFFKDIDWSRIDCLKPPFIPKLQSETDTRYFQKHKAKQPWEPCLLKAHKDYNFAVFDYKPSIKERLSTIADQKIHQIQQQKLVKKSRSFKQQPRKNKIQKKPSKIGRKKPLADEMKTLKELRKTTQGSSPTRHKLFKEVRSSRMTVGSNVRVKTLFN